jgi:DNA-binding response OmpR family regulator
MTKPYSPRELMARVRVLLRRGQRGANPARQELRSGELVVDPVRHTVTADGLKIECTPAEFRILETLITEPERVFTREQLLEQIHGFDRYITERTVDVHVKNLRKKIEPDPRKPVRLVTVYGIGYKPTEGAG